MLKECLSSSSKSVDVTEVYGEESVKSELDNRGKFHSVVSNDETLVTVDAPCPPVGVSCRTSGLVGGEHSFGYILTTCCDLAGAAVLTVLRNHLPTTAVRKTVLVSVVGNIAASKLLE